MMKYPSYKIRQCMSLSEIKNHRIQNIQGMNSMSYKGTFVSYLK